jgi:SAM-dependent methyltransferase
VTRDKYSRLEYRRLIAWPQRLEREAPLLEKVLSSGPSPRLLDLGCGTGEHSRFLAGLGFEVVGVDSSASMIATARGEPVPENLEFLEGDLRRIEDLVTGRFGGAICLGNTLPHIRQEAELRHMLEGLRCRLLPTAPLMIQLLNYERIFERGERHLPLNFRSDGEEEIVFLRLMKLQDDGQVLFFPSTLRLLPGADRPLEVKASKEVQLRGWRVQELEMALAEAGFDDLQRLGNFGGGGFDPLISRDLILVAR